MSTTEGVNSQPVTVDKSFTPKQQRQIEAEAEFWADYNDQMAKVAAEVQGLSSFFD